MNKPNSISIKNREINFKYDIVDRYECGIGLIGSEVKSIRDGKCNLKDSFALLRNNEITLKNMYIAPFEHENMNVINSTRDRKLLLHKLEILKISNFVNKGGYTLIPNKIYSKGKWLKLELDICIGKKIYDKRQSMKEKDARRQINEFKKG